MTNGPSSREIAEAIAAYLPFTSITQPGGRPVLVKSAGVYPLPESEHEIYTDLWIELSDGTSYTLTVSRRVWLELLDDDGQVTDTVPAAVSHIEAGARCDDGQTFPDRDWIHGPEIYRWTTPANMTWAVCAMCLDLDQYTRLKEEA